jgi:disulfide bond formation protein DsbB
MSHVQDDTFPQDDGAPSLVSGIDAVIARINAASRYIALLAAWIATSGSLFMSEVLLWVPCVLCWYQRILMYPLTLLLTVGILRRDRGLHLYVLPLSLLGAIVALYHYLLVKTDFLPLPPCTASIPCTIVYMNVLGFINVPFLALTAFLLISIMVTGAALGAADELEEPITPRQRMLRLLAVIGIPVVVVLYFVVWGMRVR